MKYEMKYDLDLLCVLEYSKDIKGYRLDVFYVEGFYCICSCNDFL